LLITSREVPELPRPNPEVENFCALLGGLNQFFLQVFLELMDK
jgi:hypothetical protein